jgi:hypothetical protein
MKEKPVLHVLLATTKEDSVPTPVTKDESGDVARRKGSEITLKMPMPEVKKELVPLALTKARSSEVASNEAPVPDVRFLCVVSAKGTLSALPVKEDEADPFYDPKRRCVKIRKEPSKPFPVALPNHLPKLPHLSKQDKKRLVEFEQ